MSYNHKGTTRTNKKAVELLGNGWTFSCIDGDPVYGDKILCYATNHFSSEDVAKSLVVSAVNELNLLKCHGFSDLDVMRAKIEEVVFDVRYDNATKD